MTPCFSSSGTRTTTSNTLSSTEQPLPFSAPRKKTSSSFGERGGAAPAISVVTGTPRTFPQLHLARTLHFRASITDASAETVTNFPAIAHPQPGKTLLLQKVLLLLLIHDIFSHAHTHTLPSAETPRIDRRRSDSTVARFTGERRRSLSFFVRFRFSPKKNGQPIAPQPRHQTFPR